MQKIIVKLAERVLEIIENIPLVEMSFERKKIKDKIENLFKPIVLHLIKLSILTDDIEHWEKEISNFLLEIEEYIKNPKKGAFVSKETAFDLAYTQPLTTIRHNINDNPYILRIKNISREYNSKIIDLTLSKKINFNEIKILDDAVKISIKRMINELLYEDNIININTNPLKNIFGDLIEQTKGLK